MQASPFGRFCRLVGIFNARIFLCNVHPETYTYRFASLSPPSVRISVIRPHVLLDTSISSFLFLLGTPHPDKNRDRYTRQSVPTTELATKQGLCIDLYETTTV